MTYICKLTVFRTYHMYFCQVLERGSGISAVNLQKHKDIVPSSCKCPYKK
jgi:hypothetical protein